MDCWTKEDGGRMEGKRCVRLSYCLVQFVRDRG